MYFRDGLEDPLEDHGLISQQLEQVSRQCHSPFVFAFIVTDFYQLTLKINYSASMLTQHLTWEIFP